MSKADFQKALQASIQIHPLVTMELDSRIQSIATLATTAENTFWTAAAAEFEQYGAINCHAARDVADTMCASALTPINTVLNMLRNVCEGADHVDWNWSSTPTDVAKQSFYAPAVSAVCSVLLSKVVALRTALAACNDYAEYTNVLAQAAAHYEWAVAAFAKFGPKFPTPMTAFYSSYQQEDYMLPVLSGAINSSGQAVFVNLVDGATKVALNGASSGFHQVTAGDTILIERLDGDVLSPLSHLVGMSGLLVDSIDANGMILESASGESLGETLPAALTTQATEFGTGFRLRKVKDA